MSLDTKRHGARENDSAVDIGTVPPPKKTYHDQLLSTLWPHPFPLTEGNKPRRFI